MTALLQFEIDRKRWKGTAESFSGMNSSDGPMQRLYHMAKTAACDTLYRGGTFVLVVTDDKVTMVQRDDTEDL